MVHIAAEWTTEAEQPPQPCDRCHALVPHAVWIHNVNTNQRYPNAPPRHHCQSCFDYYLKKPTTRVVEQGKNPNPQPQPEIAAAAAPALSGPAVNPQPVVHGPVNPAVIYQNTLAGQRPDLGYQRVPVQALPPSMTASKYYQPGLPYNPLAHMAPAPAFRPGYNGWPPMGYPQPPAGTFPQIASSVPPPTYGYGPQHQQFSQETAKYIRLQKEGQSQSFQVTIQVVYELENAEVKGRKFKRYEPLDNLADTVRATPFTSAGEIVAAARLQAQNLVKSREAEFCYFNFNFNTSAVRDPTSWADLEKLGDADPRPGYFYDLVMAPPPSKGGKAGNFNAKPALQFKAPKEPPLVVVVVPWKVYNRYLHHIEEMELVNHQGSSSVHSTKTTGAKRPLPATRPTPSAATKPKRSRRTDNSGGGDFKQEAQSDSFVSESQDQALTGVTAPGPLSRNEMAKVLANGGSDQLKISEVQAFRAVVENVLLYKVQDHRLETIKELEDRSFIAQLSKARGYHATLTIEAHKSKKGAQKSSHSCTFVSSPDPDTLTDVFGGNRELVAKRPFHQSGPGFMTRFGVTEELPILSTECNTTYFANAFMHLTYDFIAEAEVFKGEQPPFKVPRLRFVKTALCTVLTPHGAKDATNQMIGGLKVCNAAISPSIRLAYMIEERIQDKFVKYVHNGDPVPFVPLDSPYYEVAQFLCFTQHVQYHKTGGLAFLSDYQGGGDLLTDPQIMTSDLGKHTFGAGNIPEGLDEFEEKHECNKYCEWYELEPFTRSDDGTKTRALGGSKP